MDDRLVLAQKIRKYRRGQNINQYDFAEDCGISRTLLSLIETGSENVTIDTMQLLAARMGVTLSELLNHHDITYFVFPSKATVDNIERNTYGIGAIRNGVMIRHILDVSLDFDKMRSLVLLCNNESLSLIHLDDVAEDVLLDID